MDTPFNYKTFKKNIKSDFSRLYEIQSKLEEYDHPERQPIEYDDVDEMEEIYRSSFEGLLDEVQLKLAYAFERLNCLRMRGDLQADYSRHSKNKRFLEFEHSTDVFYSPAKSVLHDYFSVISSELDETGAGWDSESKMELLKKVLRNTAKIVFDAKITPSKEKDVKDLLYNSLRIVFEDVVREMPIAHVDGSYKPDFGVKSLETAIEYKFAANEAELRKSLGGIYEDMHGYSGSKDWTNFIAVVYCNNHYMTQEQFNQEFIIAKSMPNWFPIMVVGQGERKRKAAKGRVKGRKK